MKSLILSLFALLALPLQAQYDASENSLDYGSSAGGGSSPESTSELISEVKSITPGQSFRVAFKLTHPPHFHSYYHNDGIGISIIPTLEWKLPDGFTASPLVYPAPKEFSFSGLTAYGYEDTNYFFTTITAPANLKVGDSVKLSANADWQMCDENSCQPPESATPALDLSIAAESTKNPEFDSLKSYIDQKVPNSMLPASWKVSAKEEKGTITLSITGDLPKELNFYEFDGQIDAQQARTHTSEGQLHTFTGKRNNGNQFSDEKPTNPNLRGVLVSTAPVHGTTSQSFWIDVKLGGKAAAASTAPSNGGNTNSPKEKKLGKLAVFPLLFLGGLILNLMPCVFPVIGLKIMGFVQQAGKDKNKIKLHGLAFTVGVLLSFLGLAAILYPIKGSTTLGAQLQEPWVVFVLLIVMLLLALSMSGLFEIGTKATSVGGKLTQKDGVSGSFFSGILAVVIATPCSAPFLGPAIGAAWNYNGPLFFAALFTMGLGLSLPYLILAFVPSLVNKLPRPGAWMESFKQGMAFLLYATVAYLSWVYLALAGEEGQKGLFILLGLTVIALATWIYGRWNQPVKSTKTRTISKILALLTISVGFVLAMPPKDEQIEWQTWSPESVKAALAEGKPVYVDFTAKWCVTCQTNKVAAYNDEVRALIKKHGIVMLKADMTKKHPEATKAIHALGRSAIPVNVLHVPGDDTPHVTSEVLSPDYLIDFISERLNK